MDRKEVWYYVSLPHATFAICIAEGKVVDAAPIARWMVGRSSESIKPYLRKHKAIVIHLNDNRI